MNEAPESRLDDDGYKARAGALTLLFVSGAMDREFVLDLLERALFGGVLRSIDEVLGGPERFGDYDDDEDDDDYESSELGEDHDDEDDYEEEDEDLLAGGSLALAPAPGEIGPHTPMRTSIKGEQFLYVVAILERWLQNCPTGPLQLGPEGAVAIAPLVCCWSATVTHALASEPLTLAELDRAVGILDFPTLEEHLEAMEHTGQAEALLSGGEVRYTLTDWGREAIGPICAAIRFERHYPEEDTLQPDILDVEAAYQMSLPLLRLPADLSGSCRMGVQIPGDEPLMAGATAEVEGGRVASCSPLLEEDPETWATGSPLDWLDTVVDPSAARIEAGGDTHLTTALIECLHETLFSVPVA